MSAQDLTGRPESQSGPKGNVLFTLQSPSLHPCHIKWAFFIFIFIFIRVPSFCEMSLFCFLLHSNHSLFSIKPPTSLSPCPFCISSFMFHSVTVGMDRIKSSGISSIHAPLFEPEGPSNPPVFLQTHMQPPSPTQTGRPSPHASSGLTFTHALPPVLPKIFQSTSRSGICPETPSPLFVLLSLQAEDFK